MDNPNIEFDESNMQQLSDFLNSNNATEAFQQVFAVGSISDLGGGGGVAPSITDFYHDTVAVGIGDTLTIVGSGFGFSSDGVFPPSSKRLLFSAIRNNTTTTKLTIIK